MNTPWTLLSRMMGAGLLVFFCLDLRATLREIGFEDSHVCPRRILSLSVLAYKGMNLKIKLKALFKPLLGLSVTVLAFFLVFRNIHWMDLAQVFASIQWPWFLTAVLTFGAACLAAAWRWHLMLGLTGGQVHWGSSVRFFFIGHAFNFLLFGPAVGDVAKSALYAKWYRVPFPSIISAAPLDRMLGLAGLGVFCLIALSIGSMKGAMQTDHWMPHHIPVSWILATLIVGISMVALIVRWRPKSHSAVARTYIAFAEGLKQLITRPKIFGMGLGLGLMVQTILCLVQALCLRSIVSVECPWLSMLWVFPVIAVMTALPSVAGLGVREGAAMVLLGWYGVPQADAVAASLLILPVNLFWVGVGLGIYTWEQRLIRKMPAAETPVSPCISAVIPARNEAKELRETILRLRQVSEITEIILVDGGSTDSTSQIARDLGCRVLSSPEPNRGLQLRLGAEAAEGEVLLLVHADTWVPPHIGSSILRTLQDRWVIGGGCWKVFRHSPWLLKGSRLKCLLRILLARRVMSDQAIFIRKSALSLIGGIPDQPLMEEFELCKRLRKHGRLVLAEATVITSPRRFLEHGILRTYWNMWKITVQYYCGASPRRLKHSYEGDPKS